MNARPYLRRGAVVSGTTCTVLRHPTVVTDWPDIDQQRFSAIAASLIGNHSQLRNIAAAPDLVIRLMYPTEGNEKAIGRVSQAASSNTRIDNSSLFVMSLINRI